MEFTIKEAQPIQPEFWQIGFFILIFQLWYFRVTILNSDGEKFMQSFPEPVFNVTHFADIGTLWLQVRSKGQNGFSNTIHIEINFKKESDEEHHRPVITGTGCSISECVF